MGFRFLEAHQKGPFEESRVDFAKLLPILPLPSHFAIGAFIMKWFVASLRVSLLSTLCWFAMNSYASSQTVPDGGKTLGSIEKMDPSFDQLVDSKAKIEVLAGGFTWTEGPVWMNSEDGAIFCSRTFHAIASFSGIPSMASNCSCNLRLHGGDLLWVGARFERALEGCRREPSDVRAW